MVVYDKYFSLQAPQQLGFSDGLRCSIESNICRESGPEHTCFDVPLRVVLYVLNTVYMPGYLRSTLYQSYVADLMAAVRTMRWVVDSAYICGGKFFVGRTCAVPILNNLIYFTFLILLFEAEVHTIIILFKYT